MQTLAPEKKQIKKLCLLAGDGYLPIALAQNAIAEGVELIIFSLCKTNLRELEKISKTFYFSPFEVTNMVNKARELDLYYGTFIGKFPKSILFTGLHKIEKKFVERVFALDDLNDDSIHNLILDFIEKENGFKIIDQTLFLKDFFPGEEIFTNRKPVLEEIEEARYGLSMAKGIAGLDIGQTVVVQNKSVIAVEAIEGTNEAIKRAKNLAKGFLNLNKNKYIMVCKVSKPNQDQRFDVPTVGFNTIKMMPNDSLLVFEANEVFFPSQVESIELANKKNICIFSLSIS